MCCHGSYCSTEGFLATIKSTERFLSTIKPGVKYISGWKVLTLDGLSWFRHYRYHPGTHKVDIDADRYPSTYQGIHFYLVRPWGAEEITVLRIRVRPQDIVLAECEQPKPRRYTMPEAVASRIQIETREWKRAGLPMPKKRQAI